VMKSPSVSFQTMDLPLFFISDVHLRLATVETEKNKRENLINFIDHVAEQGGSLFIVGDFFDFWFEYKYVIPKAYFEILSALQEAKRKGVTLNFVLGNHDYWTGEFIKERIFNKVYEKETYIEVGGKQIFVTHGDGLLSWERGYRIFRAIIRNPLFVFLYRWIHPDLGYAFARWISRRSRHYNHTDEYNDKIMGELSEYAGNICQNGADYVVMGHYHQAKEVKLTSGKLIVLGDWIRYNTFAVFDGDNLSLNYWR